MERRWPLGLGLLLLLCAPLPPGARAKEGTDPRSRPSPSPSPGARPAPASRSRHSRGGLLRAPLSSSLVLPRRQAIDWPGQPLVFDPATRCFPGSVTLANSLRPVVGRELLTAAGTQRPDPYPSDRGHPSFPGGLSLRCPSQRSGPHEVRDGKLPYAILGRRTEGPAAGRWTRTRGAGAPRCTGQALQVKACTPSLALPPLLPRLSCASTLNCPPPTTGRAGPLPVEGNLPTQEPPLRSPVHTLPTYDPQGLGSSFAHPPFQFCS